MKKLAFLILLFLMPQIGYSADFIDIKNDDEFGTLVYLCAMALMWAIGFMSGQQR